MVNAQHAASNGHIAVVCPVCAASRAPEFILTSASLSRRAYNGCDMRLLSLLCVTLAYGDRPGGPGPFAEIHAIWPFNEQACRTSPRVAAANQSINFTTFNCIPYEESLEITEAMSFAVVDSILARLPAVGRVAIVAQVWYVAQRASISRAVRAGVALFLVESSFDLAEYDIDLTQHLVLEFWPDNSAGASSVGQELCRRVGSPQRLRVAGLYPAGGGGEWGAYSVRVDGAIAALQRCLDNRIGTRTALDIGPMITAEGWGQEEAREIFESVFMTDVGIDAVITAGDNPAIGVIEAADSMLTLQDAQSLFVSGFDDDPMLEPYLQTGRAFATVNQLLDFPNFGVWHSLPDMIDVIAGQSYATPGLERHGKKDAYPWCEVKPRYQRLITSAPRSDPSTLLVTVALLEVVRIAVRLEGLDAFCFLCFSQTSQHARRGSAVGRSGAPCLGGTHAITSTNRW